MMKKLTQSSALLAGSLLVSLHLYMAIVAAPGRAPGLNIAQAFHTSSAVAQRAHVSTMRSAQRSTLPPITIALDATEAPRKILHARLTISAKPGPLTLYYPKWIPGEHGPMGPITDLAGLKMTVAGKIIPWRRDDVDMYAFHLDVPAAQSALEVALDFLLPAGTEGFSSAASSTANLAVLSWNHGSMRD